MTEKLDVKIGTKEEARWTKVKDQASESLEANKIEAQISQAIIELAKKKIKAEIVNFK